VSQRALTGSQADPANTELANTESANTESAETGAGVGSSRTLVPAALGTFLALVAFTLPMSALPTLATALHAGPAAQTWVLSSMSVGLAAGLLVSGAMADDFGRRRMFVAGAGVLAVTLVIGASVSSPLPFVLARVGQGLGAAALVACGLGLVGHHFPAGPARARATGIWGASVGAGIAAGPLLAALLDTSPAGWRAAYLLVALLTAALGVVSRVLLAESRAARSHPVDVAGAVLLGTGLSALLAGLVTGRDGWVRPLVIVLLAGGALLLVAFVVVERRGPAPLLDLALFRRPDFVAATAAGLATGLGVIAAMSLVSTVIERGLGGSPVVGALALLAWSGVSVFTALAARRLPARIDGDMQLAAGLLVVAVGLAALAGLHPGDGLGRLLPGLVVAGLGSGVLNAALGRQAVASVPAGRAGMGSGANNTARYLGSAIGVTVAAVLATRPVAGGLLVGWNAAVLVSVLFSVLGAAVVLGCLRWRRAA
jgi:MFS family permease